MTSTYEAGPGLRAFRPFLVFCAGLVVLSAFSATAQVLSYSTYLAKDFNAGSFALNGAGESCVFAGTVIAKLDSNGATIFSISTQTPSLNVGNGSVAIDSQGNCYMAAIGTITPTPGAFQSAPKVSNTGQVVVKFNGAGNTVYGTYLGGSDQDFPQGLATDSNGNIYLTGFTSSNDFPTLHAFQTTLHGGQDAFIAVLNSTGTALIYATYLGGAAGESGRAIAVDDAKNAYITGSTFSTDFPTVFPFQGALTGTADNAFVTKLDPSGTPIYSTYLGGTTPPQNAEGLVIAADPDGNAYVAGKAGTGFPLVIPIQSTGVSAFVSKLNANGSALLYSTLLGEITTPAGIAVDSARRTYVAGNVVVNGNTNPPGSLPLLSPIQSSFGTGLSDGFLSVLNSAGTSLVFSSYLGGDEDSVSGLGIDSAANIYLAGVAGGPFPIVNAANGVYLPLVPIPKVGIRPGSQSFIQKISLLSGTSFSHPTTVDFRPDPLPVGQSATAPVLLANTAASGNIAISNIVITGDYSQTNDCPNTLLPATSCKFQVIFAPAAEGNRSGNITVTDTAPGSPHVISLIGTGLVPHVSLTPNPLAFTSQAVGTSSATQAVTLTNTGGAVLTISSITTTGDFSESNDCGSQIGPGSCHISVLFLPTALGNRTGVLSVVDSASGSPHTVNLSGTAVAPNLGLGVPIGGMSTATVSAGSPATYMLSIGGNGIGGVASLSCTGSPKGATCSVPPTENVDAGAPATFTVSVTTTSRSVGMLRSPGLSRSSWLWTMATITLFVLPSLSASRRSMSRKVRFVPLMLVLLLCSCGGGGGSNTGANPNGTPVGTYNLTVNAVSGPNTQSSTLTLIVR